jgi:hypothetical protein
LASGWRISSKKSRKAVQRSKFKVQGSAPIRNFEH